MKKYTIFIEQSETFIAEVEAKNEEEAEEKAWEQWDEGSCQETGNLSVDITNIIEEKS